MDHQVVDRNPFITSLRSSALRVCVLHANNYVSLGDLPYVLVQPILEACTPNRLALLEDQSPHLRADTQDLWKRHISQKFHVQVETREDEDWRDVYERLKLEESARLESATARLRAKNGKLKEEKMAKRIVVIDPKKTAVIGDRKRSHPFGSMSSVRTKRLKAVHTSPPRKGNSLMEKARKSTSMTKMNYASAPRFSTARPSGSSLFGGARPGQSKIRKEPAPANDNTVFGRPPTESPKVPFRSRAVADRRDNTKVSSRSFFDAIGK